MSSYWLWVAAAVWAMLSNAVGGGLLLAAADLRHSCPLCVIRRAFDKTRASLSLAPSNITC